jgi:hypothetical protein
MDLSAIIIQVYLPHQLHSVPQTVRLVWAILLAAAASHNLCCEQEGRGEEEEEEVKRRRGEFKGDKEEVTDLIDQSSFKKKKKNHPLIHLARMPKSPDDAQPYRAGALIPYHHLAEQCSLHLQT